jgi:hypothetical protein
MRVLSALIVAAFVVVVAAVAHAAKVVDDATEPLASSSSSAASAASSAPPVSERAHDPWLDVCCAEAGLSPERRIACENALPGAPSSEWDVNGFGDPTIQGFATDISFNVGTTASFKIDSTDSKAYRVDVYRTGYYRGLGARLVATLAPSVELPFAQPPCRRNESTQEYSCRDWRVTVTWGIPSDAVSGVYIARLVRTDGAPHKTWRADNSQAGDDPRFAMPGASGRPKPANHAYGANGLGELRNPLREPRASHIYFVVRDDSSRADIVFQTSDTVWQAYNHYGGTSMYGSFDPANPKPRCYKASYDRPLRTREPRPANSYLGSEFPLVQFLEQHGYSVTYIAGVDTDRLGLGRLLQHKLFLSVGHDEYWSGAQRDNVRRARDLGLHLAFLSGNEMFWRVRWEDGYRTMVVYKETQHPTKLDPMASEWTGTFRDSRPINPLGAQPENAIIGQLFTLNAWRNDPLVVPRRFATLRWWKNTQVERMAKPASAAAASAAAPPPPPTHVAYLRGVLGHEMDEDIDNGFRPPGVIHLSETHIDNVMYIQDFGATYDSGHGVHRMTLYRRRGSGAIVWGAGTCQWSWALANMHDSESGIPAPAVNHLNTRVGTDVMAPVVDLQQFTVTVFAAMGALPFTARRHPGQAAASDEHLPQWYTAALARGETFRVLKLPRDVVAPNCSVVAVEFDMAAAPRIFADGEGRPERFARVVVEAQDRDGGVVAAVEVSVARDRGRWHFGFPLSDEPLTGAASRWSVIVPLRETIYSPATYADRAASDAEARDLVVKALLKHATCRATDDSLNTDYAGYEQQRPRSGKMRLRGGLLEPDLEADEEEPELALEKEPLA